MLHSEEYEAIKLDYDETSRHYFPRAYRPPPGLKFQDSDGLFPTGDLREQIEEDYSRECRLLFAGRPFPTPGEVIERLEDIRELL